MLKTAEEIRKELKIRQEKLIRLLKTQDGKEALLFLVEKYGKSVTIQGDPYMTHVRIGERNVVDYLQELSEVDNV